MLPVRLKRRQTDVILLLIGVLIGWLTVQLLQLEFLPKSGVRCRKYLSDTNFGGFNTQGHPRSSREQSSKLKGLLLVGVMTTRRDLATRATAIRDTWGKGIPGRVIFYIGETERQGQDGEFGNTGNKSAMKGEGISSKQTSAVEKRRIKTKDNALVSGETAGVQLTGRSNTGQVTREAGDVHRVNKTDNRLDFKDIDVPQKPDITKFVTHSRRAEFGHAAHSRVSESGTSRIRLKKTEKVRFIDELPVVELQGVSDEAYPPQAKSFAMLRHMQVNFGDEFHWFMRADSDVLVRPEPLSKFLSSIDSSRFLYLGQPGTGVPNERGKLGLRGGAPYCMGGPGVLLSAPTLELLVPHLEKCGKQTVTSHEDTELGRCLQHYVNITCSRSAQMSLLFYQNYRDKNGSFTGELDPKIFSALTLHPVKDARHMYRLHVLLETSRLQSLQHRQQRYRTTMDAITALGDEGGGGVLRDESGKHRTKRSVGGNSKVSGKHKRNVENPGLDPKENSSKSELTQFTKKQFTINSSASARSLLSKNDTEGAGTNDQSLVQNLPFDTTMDPIITSAVSRPRNINQPVAAIHLSTTADNCKPLTVKETLEYSVEEDTIWDFVGQDYTFFSLSPLVHSTARTASRKAQWYFTDFHCDKAGPNTNETFGRIVARYQRVSVAEGLQHVLIKSVNNRTRSVTLTTRFDPLQWREIETCGDNEKDPSTKVVGMNGSGELHTKLTGVNDHETWDKQTSNDRNGATAIGDNVVHQDSKHEPRHRRDLWLLLSLCNRYKAYVRFLQYLSEAARSYPGRIYLRVALFPDTWGNHERSLFLTDQYRMPSTGKRPMNLDITVINMNVTFSRARALHELSSRLHEHALLVLMDVDLVLTSSFLFRVARNAGFGRAYFPVNFAQYYPETVCYGLVNCTPGVFDFARDAGTWRHFSYGVAALTAGGLRRVGGMDTSIKGWGKEDVDLFSRCVSKGLHIMRALDPGLVHVHHNRSCDPKLARDQLRMCRSSLVALYGSIHKLAQMVMDRDKMNIVVQSETNRPKV